MNKFSKGAICLSVALACAWGAKAQNVELTPDFCNAVKQYDVVQTFHDGMAAVLKDGKWGYISSEGKEVITCSIPKQYDVCIDREDYGFSATTAISATSARVWCLWQKRPLVRSTTTSVC